MRTMYSEMNMSIRVRDIFSFFPKLKSWVNKDQSYIRECMKASFNFPAHGQVHPQISQILYPIPPKLLYLATSYLKIAHWSILLRGNDGHGGDLKAHE